ncbi:predicted protein [Nematostella vectensis]|uniref:CUB domain-containing protein n=1 Tax=Nematostella vectensis TaxID=45351 RepID=A7SAA6_NEMVE|nr:predicted protein [Nematostella vectensis]|eukprot:XP_001631429.1 predicted protein [Nematostella vectensis]
MTHPEILLALIFIPSLVAAEIPCTNPKFSCTDPMLFTKLDDEISVGESSVGSNGRHCIFNIETISPGFLVLTFEEFFIDDNMPHCKSNYLEIKIGCNPSSIGRFCGSTIPHQMISYDHCMVLTYHTNGKNASQGFKASYISEDFDFSSFFVTWPRNGSTGHLDNKVDAFPSHSWPRLYPSGYVYQQWVIGPIKQGWEMKLSFMMFDLARSEGENACDLGTSDLVSISVGLKQNITRCGRQRPFFFIFGKAEFVNITFITNGDSLVRRGFVAGYIIYKRIPETPPEIEGLCGSECISLATVCAILVFGIFIIFIYSRVKVAQLSREGDPTDTQGGGDMGNVCKVMEGEIKQDPGTAVVVAEEWATSSTFMSGREEINEERSGSGEFEENVLSQDLVVEVMVEDRVDEEMEVSG